MSEEKQQEGPAMHSEVVALRKRLETLEARVTDERVVLVAGAIQRLETLEARVTELEKELRETQEIASSD